MGAGGIIGIGLTSTGNTDMALFLLDRDVLEETGDPIAAISDFISAVPGDEFRALYPIITDGSIEFNYTIAVRASNPEEIGTYQLTALNGIEINVRQAPAVQGQ